MILAELPFAPAGNFQVVQGNLLEEPVDAIVNAANGHLAHGGGVAGIISRAAGPALQRESDRIVRERGPLPAGSAVATGAGELPFTPAGLNDWTTHDPAAEGDYTGSCLPFGMTRSINSPDPLQIMQSDKYVGLLFEQNSWFHIVRMDRDHPKNVEPTWFGDSVGHWDGDTLVVDTIGVNGWTRLDTIGHPHSDAMHLIQTFLRTDAGHIAYTITVDDPKAYTRPWKNERTFMLMNTEIMEYSCEENNKDLREGHIRQWTPPETSRYPATPAR